MVLLVLALPLSGQGRQDRIMGTNIRSDRTATETDDNGQTADLSNMESMLRQVDQLQDAMYGDMVRRLEEENIFLQWCIRRGRQRLTSISKVFLEAFQSYVVMNAAIEEMQHSMDKMDEEWASFLFSETVDGT